MLDAFLDATEQAGIPRTPDFNTGSNEGGGYFDVNQRSGIRWNAAKAFLRPAARRPNLRILTEAPVERLVVEGGEVTGVEYRYVGGVHRAHAGETVLSAGAVNTPCILEMSGIGRGDVLQAAGIAPVCEVASVGENLQDHLQLRLIYKVTGVPTLNEKASRLMGKAAIGLEYALRRSGPMSMSPSQVGIFTRSSEDRATPDLQFHIQPVSLGKFGDAVHAFPAITASVCNLVPRAAAASTSPTRGRGQISGRTTCPQKATSRLPPRRFG